jgi:hypothetical protein
MLSLCSIIQAELQSGNPTPPVRGDASAAVLQAIPFPQPNPVSIRVLLYKETPAVCVRVYRPDGSLFFAQCIGDSQAGWTQIPLPAAWADASAGRYYFNVDAGGQFDADRSGTLVRWR